MSAESEYIAGLEQEIDLLKQENERLKRTDGKLNADVGNRFLAYLGAHHNEFLEEAIIRVVDERNLLKRQLAELSQKLKI